MAPLRSVQPIEHEADFADPRLTPQEREGNSQTQQIEDESSDLQLRGFKMSPPNKTLSDNFRVDRQTEKSQSERRQRSPGSGELQRPRSAGRHSSGDRLVVSRSKNGPRVIRRIQSSSGPKPASVEDAQEDSEMGSTRAVDSDSDYETHQKSADRISSTTFVARTASNEAKARSGSPTDGVDPVFLQLSQHEKKFRNRVSSSKGIASPPSGSAARGPSAKVSPGGTEHNTGRRRRESSSKWSPRSLSSTSSTNSNSRRSPAETEGTTPDPSISGGDLTYAGLGLRGSFMTTNATRAIGPATETTELRSAHNTATLDDDIDEQTPDWRYGTPEMARGHAKLPVLSPAELQPRPAIPGVGHPKHLPRAEKLPMSGYELLASKLSASGTRPRPRSAGLVNAADTAVKTDAAIKPIYRRFESLNHRLLLHLQDELSELEEQLHRLDTADTQTRRLQNCILPASRRAESMAAGELQWHKTDILTKLGAKLNQYNSALASFSETQQLPPARTTDIQVYRSFLSKQNPIAEIETRFLDSSEDLVTLTKSPSHPLPSFSSTSPRSPYHHETIGQPRTPDPDANARSKTRDGSPISSAARKGSSSGVTRRDSKDDSSTAVTKRRSASKSYRDPFSRDGRVTGLGGGNLRLGKVAIVAGLGVLLPMVVFRIMAVTNILDRIWLVSFGMGAVTLVLKMGLVDVGFWLGGSAQGRIREEEEGDKGEREAYVFVSAADLDAAAVAYGVVMGVVAVLF